MARRRKQLEILKHFGTVDFDPRWRLQESPASGSNRSKRAMNLLVDTCIWSLVLRRKSKASLSPEDQKFVSRLADAIQDGNVVIIGPVRQEILSGIKDELQFAKTAKLLDPFLDDSLDTADYIEAARLYNLCRGQGVQCGPADMLICSVWCAGAI